jgi:hypothetical protein
MSLSEKINEFYHLFLQNDGTELEVRFGTRGEHITKNKLDTTINKLKSVGFSLYKEEYTLKIQPEYLDPKSGKKKISSVRVEINGLPNIQKYCKTNKLTDNRERVLQNIVFTRKSPLLIKGYGETTKVQPYNVDDFNFRISLQKDFKMLEHDGIVKSTLSNWESSKKVFRYMKRTTFRHPDYPFSIDLSIVKMSNKNSRHYMIPTYTLVESNVLNNPNTYEIEIECDKIESGKEQLYHTIKTVLCGIQNSNFPIKKTEKSEVEKSYYNLIHKEDPSTRILPKHFIGPSSISLEMHHLQEETEVNILENYSITDKADGVRKLLYISTNGKVYLIDVNMNIQFTGLINKISDLNNTLIDGEHIIHNKLHHYYNHYAAFDIYFMKGTDIRMYDFTNDSKQNRLFVINAIVKKLKFDYVVKSSTNLKIGVKQFYKGENIFNDCASLFKTIDELEYETDGLIFTPTNYGVGAETLGDKPANKKKTWLRSFKWKPPEYNTIDFFVTTKKDQSGFDEVKNIFEDGISTSSSSNIKEYKTLTLRVGYDESKHGYINPLESIVNNEKFEKVDMDTQSNYKPVKFYPMEPSDLNAGECNILLDQVTKNMVCENGDIIEDNSIVELKYVMGNKEKFKWVPIRVRYDKLQELRAGQKNYGNAYHVAESVWKSIHNPITKEILSGTTEIPSITSTIYYNSTDKKICRAMRDFHNLYIKKQLIKGVSSDGYSLIDMAVGKGGDIPKWQYSRLGFVYGIDISRDNIENKKDGACARYLDMKRKKRIFDGLFVPGDTSKNLKSGDAFYSEKIHDIHNAIFGKGARDKRKLGEGVYNLYGKASDGFDVVSCQFAIHYMFENKEKLETFIKNVSDCCKIGGYFIGTCYDGRKIFNMLTKHKIGEGISKRTKDRLVCQIIKQYEFDTFDNNESCLGYAIDVYQDCINNTLTEYLVNFDYLKIIMEHFGFVLIDDLEAQTMQLDSSITSFEDAYKNMETMVTVNKDEKKYIGNALKMNKEEKFISFLNNYFIFKKVRNIGAVEEKKPKEKKKKRKIKLNL